MPIYMLTGSYTLPSDPTFPPHSMTPQRFEAPGDEEAREEVRRRQRQHPGMKLSDLVLKRLGPADRTTEVPL